MAKYTDIFFIDYENYKEDEKIPSYACTVYFTRSTYMEIGDYTVYISDYGRNTRSTLHTVLQDKIWQALDMTDARLHIITTDTYFHLTMKQYEGHNVNVGSRMCDCVPVELMGDFHE